MQQHDLQQNVAWDEQASRAFIGWGRYFVPERETQIGLLCDLVPAQQQPFHVVELCCGEGLLASALLERFPSSLVHGYDGSQEMLDQAQAKLRRFGERFTARHFDLAREDWRDFPWPLHAVLSSLAIHHLDAEQKRQLYQDIHRALQPGGVFLIADVVEPASLAGVAVAAQSWDEAVRQRALQFDGHLRAFEYFERERWNIYRSPDPGDKPSPLFDQLKWLEQAGFVEVDVYWVKAGHAIFGGRKAMQ